MLAVLLGLTAISGFAESPAFEAAVSLYDARNYSEARRVFRTLAALQPGNGELDYYLGRLALWFNDESEAEARLEAAAKNNPRDARIQNALGDAYGLAAQEAALLLKPRWACKCRCAYEQAIALDPANPRYHWSLLGYCLMAPRIVGGGCDRAEAEAATIARLDPAAGRAAWSTVYLAENRAADAFAQFDAALRDNPDDYLALYQVGRCSALSGRELGRGLTALRHCLTLPAAATVTERPTLANVHWRLGDILERLGDTAGAAAEHHRAEELEPDFRPAKMMLEY
jgi:tetratricopeptide (TPR) repeat protein